MQLVDEKLNYSINYLSLHNFNHFILTPKTICFYSINAMAAIKINKFLKL